MLKSNINVRKKICWKNWPLTKHWCLFNCGLVRKLFLNDDIIWRQPCGKKKGVEQGVMGFVVLEFSLKS